jgi:hypothetical protein
MEKKVEVAAWAVEEQFNKNLETRKKLDPHLCKSASFYFRKSHKSLGVDPFAFARNNKHNEHQGLSHRATYGRKVGRRQDIWPSEMYTSAGEIKRRNGGKYTPSIYVAYEILRNGN